MHYRFIKNIFSSFCGNIFFIPLHLLALFDKLHKNMTSVQCMFAHGWVCEYSPMNFSENNMAAIQYVSAYGTPNVTCTKMQIDEIHKSISF